MVEPYGYPGAGENATAAAAGGPEMSQNPAYNAAYGALGAGAGAGAAGAAAAAAGPASETSLDGYNDGGIRRGPSTGSTLTSAGFAGRGAGGGYGGLGEPLPLPSAYNSNNPSSSPYDPAAAAAVGTPSTAASRKMREAQQERLRNLYGGSTGHSDEYNSTTAPTTPHTAAHSSGDPILSAGPSEDDESAVPRLAEDGGRYEPRDEELPPQYHSIPSDRR